MRSNVFFFAGLAAMAQAAIDPSIIAQIPDCATGPLISGVTASGCQITDTDCICGNAALISNLQTAVKADCNAADLAKALEVTGQICPGAGAGSVSSAASSASSESSTSVASVVSSISSAAATAITTDFGSPTTAASGTVGTASSMINYTATTGDYTAPSTPTVTPSTGGAAKSFALGSMVMGIGALGMLFAGL